MRFVKVLFSCLLLLSYSFQSNVIDISAHTVSQSQYHTGEIYYTSTNKFNVGWHMKHTAGHSGVANNTYKFDKSVTASEQTLFKKGVSKWSSYASLGQSDTGKGTIYTYNDSDDSAVAYFKSVSKDSNNHCTKWVIWMNRSKTLTERVIAHEIGICGG